MSIQALREQKQALSKEANNLLANKGASIWTKEDQAKYDGITDQIELVNSQIDAHQKMLDDEADNNFNNMPKKGKDAPPITDAQRSLEVFLRKQTKHYSDEEVELIRNTMSTTTGSEGGYSVQPQVADTLIDLLKAYGFMRAVASQLKTSSGVDLSYPSSDGTTEMGEWIAQNGSATAADPVFGTRPVNVFKASSKIITVPIELLQDSQIDIAGFVMNRAADRIGRLANLGYTTGSGAGQPNGLATAASVGKTGIVGQTLTVIYDDLVDLIDSIDPAYLALSGGEPGFMFGQTMRRTIRKIKDTTGRPIWTPGYEGGMSVGTPDYLLGYPVYLNNDIAVPAANAKSIAFGKLDKYLIRDAMDVTLFKFEDSPYISKGQIGFLAWARTGGNLLDVNAVKFYQHSAT